MRLPKVTEVERLTLRPGDVLFVHVAEKLSPEVAARIKDMVAAVINRPDVRIVVLDKGITVKAGSREAG